MLKGLKSLFSRNSQPSQSQNAQRVPQRIQFFNEDPSQQQPQAQQPPGAQPAASDPTNYTTNNSQAPLPGAVPVAQPPSAFRPTSAGSTGTSTVAAAPSSAGSEGPPPLIGSEPSSVGPSSLASTPVPTGGFDASARAKLRSAPPSRTATVVPAGGLPGSSAPRAQSATVSRPTRLVQPTSDALYGGRRNEDAPLASSAFPFQKKGTTPVVTAMPSGGAVFQQGAHSRMVPDPFDA